jgi:hypothetical protein
MSNVSPIVEKVQKLLALSKSSNINEAAAAAAAANRLIDQYCLSEMDLESSGVSIEEPIEEDSGFIYESGKITVWKHNLVAILAQHYGCAHWNDCSWAGGRKVSRYRLVGKRTDIGIARYMFSYLTLECQRLSALEVKGRGRVFVSSYCEGFVSGVHAQLVASRAEVQKTASSAAIVKMDGRVDLALAEMYRLHTNLKKSKSISHGRLDGRAFSMGQDRGKSIHLGASMSSGGTRMLNK